MGWKDLIQGELKRSFARIPPSTSNIATPILKWDQPIKPKTGLLSIQNPIEVTVSINNHGNWPSYSANISLFYGSINDDFSSFTKIGSIVTSVYPGETKSECIELIISSLPSSGIFNPNHPPERILLGVCRDVFFDNFKNRDITEDNIRNNTHLSGGYYSNSVFLRNHPDMVKFSYMPIDT